MKKSILFFCSVFALSFFTNTALGAAVYPVYQLDASTSTSAFSDGWIQTLGTNIAHSTSSYFLKLDLQNNGCSLSSIGNFKIEGFSDSGYSALTQTINNNGTVYNSQLQDVGLGATSTGFYFVGLQTSTLSASNFYRFKMSCGGGSTIRLFGTPDGTKYQYGEAQSGTGLSPASTTPVADFYFLLGDSLDFQADSYYTPPFNANNATSTTFTCDPNLSFLADTLCTLFVPTQASLNAFGNLKTEIAQKPPFGYFTAVSSTLALLTTSTPTSGFSDLSGISGFASLKTFVSVFLWVSLAFWLLNRFKNFDWDL